MKTKAEIDDLKAQWKADPCWDIDCTEGYEDHQQDLAEFQRAYYNMQALKEAERVTVKCHELGCSPALLKYIEFMEYKIRKLEGE
jgi:hypothetical protein